MNKTLYITEYSYEAGQSFEGFRFSKTVSNIKFEVYVSSKKLGSRAKALARVKSIKRDFLSHLQSAKRARNGQLLKTEVKALKKILANNS